MQVNIHQAKAQLSSLIEKALADEEIVIAKAGKPLARLTPIAGATDTRSGARLGGLKRARLKLAPDFHAPTMEDDLLSTPTPNMMAFSCSALIAGLPSSARRLWRRSKLVSSRVLTPLHTL